MKNYQEFKGYSKRVDYNSESGSFQDTPTPHPFSLIPTLASGLLDFAKGKLESMRDHQMLSRMNDRDLRELGLDDRKIHVRNDRYW